MKTPQTYNIRRFETAKKLLENGMKKNKRIYLLGHGGTGKTYLTLQMKYLIDEYKYKTYPDFDSKLFKKYKIKKSTKAILCIYSFHYMLFLLSFTIIFSIIDWLFGSILLLK